MVNFSLHQLRLAKYLTPNRFLGLKVSILHGIVEKKLALYTLIKKRK